MKLFTLDEAKELLPLVRTIVTEAVKKYTVLKNLAIEAEIQGKKVSTKKASELKKDIEDAISQIKILGVEFKGLEPALVDFPHERDGETVYLCWKLGEETITHWHDLESGFAGRQPL